jgi:UDP-N-acetylmuramyl pentapeptide synthase
MSEDYEVIEIGEDGAFDIPTTSSVKQPVVEEIDYSSQEWQHKVAVEENKELLQALKPSEFAVYQNESNFWVIFRMEVNDELEDLLLEDNNEFVLKTTSEKQLKFPIDNEIKVDRETIRCKCWKEYVTISFSSL